MLAPSIEHCSSSLIAAAVVLLYCASSVFGGKCDEAKVSQHAEKAKQGLDILDRHLATNQYLAGANFSLGQRHKRNACARRQQGPLGVTDDPLPYCGACTVALVCLADVFFMPYLGLLFHTPEALLLTSRPNIFAWWKRVSERPSWVQTQAYNEFAPKNQ